MTDGLPVLPIAGIRLGTTCAGIKYANRRDVVIIEVAPHSHAAAVVTRNAFQAAPIQVTKRHLAVSSPRYLVINTGNANAGTGTQGLQDALATCRAVATLTGCAVTEVLPFSTGVIGEPLPLTRLLAGLPAALAALTADGWVEAATGIMTTDTRPKYVSRQAIIAGKPVTVTGIAKGAGMICPNMATMLAFIATDAAVDTPTLQAMLHFAVADSFNAITIDGDTSTNDACVVLATGQSGVVVQGSAMDSSQVQLQQLLNAVCHELAQSLVHDGEGATKHITIEVKEGRDRAECRQVAYTIAHSPLVKTALFASDPNWGRILAAVGRAGLSDLDVHRVAIAINGIVIVQHGERAASYTEVQGQQAMATTDIAITVQLGRGSEMARIWTTDLSLEYVRINADYRT